MELKIFAAIKKFVDSAPQRFHTPGHKGSLLTYDITEVDDSFPGDCITEAQNNAAKFFCSKYCRFLTGGSSMGMKAAIMAIGGDILVPADRHPCVDEGAELAGVELFEYDFGKCDGLQIRPTAEQIGDCLDRNPSVKAVVLLSPDYYGRVIDVSVAEEIKRRGKILIVDSAHGAHFPASDLFPQSYSTIADFCNLSGHKTLPCLTQGAYLTVNNEQYMAGVDHALKLLGTTSPSYLLLASLEYGIEFAKQNAGYYEKLNERLAEIKSAVSTLDNDDFTRLVVDTGSKNQGEKLYIALKDRGIVAEKYDERYVVFIITLCDSEQTLVKFMEELVCAVNSLP